MFRRVAIAVWIYGLLLLGIGADDAAPVPSLPEQYTDKVQSMPDLCQTDEAFASLPYRGKYWCCPTALANALVAMDQRGYENLLASDVTCKEDQLALLSELGGMQYLRTGKSGTGPLAAMHGLRQFVNSRGYQIRIQWQGWRRGGEFARADLVDRRWIAEGVLGDSNVVLNVGWYKHEPDQDLYSRIGGHYVTLVGYRNDAGDTLYLVHDPSSRSGPGKVTHEVRLIPIDSGRLAPWKRYDGRSAVGYFLLEGVAVKRSADVAILDGAIRFQIFTPSEK